MELGNLQEKCKSCHYLVVIAKVVPSVSQAETFEHEFDF